MRCRGFTLIEVMVALLIISVVFASALYALDRFSDQAYVVNLRRPAQRHAWNCMISEYLRHQGWIGEPASLNRELTDRDGKDWQVKKDVTKSRYRGADLVSCSVYKASESIAVLTLKNIYVLQ